MSRSIIISALAIATLIPAPGAEAQERWGLELRASGALATQVAERDEIQNGLGFEATLRYRFMDHLAAYAGWDWTYFPAHEAIAGSDMDLEETGYAFGLLFQHPLREGSPNAWWIRAGGTANHLELENDGGELVADSGHGLGIEVGAGLAFDIGGRWSVTPGLRYRSISRELEIDAASVPVELQYVAFEIGLAKRF